MFNVRILRLLVCLPVIGLVSHNADFGRQERNTKLEASTPDNDRTHKVETAGKPGGRLVSAFPNEPKTFNLILSRQAEGRTLKQLLTPGLTRLNLITQEPEPALAASWEHSRDFRTWTFHLRKGLHWSDGTRFTSADVLFTMQIANDPSIHSSAYDALNVSKQRIIWKQIDDYTLIAQLPSVFPPFLRQLDGTNVPILAKHKWEEVYRKGKFQEAMPVSMDPGDFVSLGPFLIREYKIAQYLKLVKNPRYWKLDQNNYRLPYLDEIVFLIVGDMNQLQLKLEAGEIDTYYNIRPQDVTRLEDRSSVNRLRVYNLGPAYDSECLILNQNLGTNPKNGQPHLDPTLASWFTNPSFRKAISFAIDRKAIVQNVFAGKGIPAYGPVSPAIRHWYNNGITKYPYDPTKALEILRGIGFVQESRKEGRPVLLDSSRNPVRFRLHTNAGNNLREAQCHFIASDLARLGIDVDFSALEFNTLVSKVTSSFDYDAVLLGFSHDDWDPTSGLNIWLSSGTLHFWWPSQDRPHTSWEERIDQLMRLQATTINSSLRKQYYDEVQAIVAEQQPIIFTVTPLIYVCARQNLGNLKPAVSRDRTLWNAEELYWISAS